MQHLTEQTENVIKLENFKLTNAQIPVEVSHPASKHYPICDDPISDLLGEFDLSVENYSQNNFKNDDLKIQYSERPKQMMSKIEIKVKLLQEKSKRIKYYLNELKY